MILENKDSIIKLDPRTKLFIMIVSVFVAVKCVAITPIFIFTVILGILLFLEGERYTAIISVSVSMIVIFMYHCMEQSGYTSGLSAFCVVLIMSVRFFFPVVMSLMLFTKTTGMSNLMAAFQKMHVPAAFTIPFIVLIRFMPTISDEWDGIKKAMRFRGITFNWKSILLKPAQTMEYMMVPLLFSSVELMDELASSAMARGLDSNNKRSSYADAQMRVIDYLIILLFIVFLIYMQTGINMR